MLFNEEAEGKSVRIVSEPLLVHRATGAGEFPNCASTLCGKRLQLVGSIELPRISNQKVLGVVVDLEVDCMTCLVREART
jgi:hypothetical protein